ncbi:uncharacterized protein pxnb isoform X2 [Denticeps clupeoides]|uniref:LIM zinc-binding domain-containing protein n=1 Tax=Denticeps clupeoides TaxID=299321 RepID=A0AAY4DV78_9TELE|nr:uncharacterized protein LOC114799931 isoform X2 [Denticeps clupeoides]
MDDLDALLADLESSAAHVSKFPLFLPEETPYSFPSRAHSSRDEPAAPPLPPPPSAEALNGALLCQTDNPHSNHSSRQSLASDQKSSGCSRDSIGTPHSQTEEDHIYSFPNKQKSSEASGAAMTSALCSNLSELDRLLLELNAVQNSSAFPREEEEAPPLQACSSYGQENGSPVGITLSLAAQEKPHRNGVGAGGEGRPKVDSLLDELETSVPVPGALTLPSGFTESQADTTNQNQTRISATSATRELDELMASLSDFKPNSLGSFIADPLFDQKVASSAIFPPPLGTDIPLPSLGSAPLELHIVEDGGESSGAMASSASAFIPNVESLIPSLSPRCSPQSLPSPSNSQVSDPEVDSVIDVSVSMLSSPVESLVVLSQTTTTFTNTSTQSSPAPVRSSPIFPRPNSHSPASSSPILKPDLSFNSAFDFQSTSPLPSSTVGKTSASQGRLTPLHSPTINGVTPIFDPKPPKAHFPKLQTSQEFCTPESPALHISQNSILPLSAPKPSLPPITPEKPIPPTSNVYKTSAPTVRTSEPVMVPQRPEHLNTPPMEPSLDEALDKLLAMSFSKPESEVKLSALDATQVIIRPPQEVFEEHIVAMDRREFHPDTNTDTHTESELGDGGLDYQSDGRSDLLDWADMELKLPYDGGDGSMTPLTEASWMDDSLTPSSCPGTPDGMLDMPLLQSGTSHLSASGHIKSVIKRTKEIPNVHPMYRDNQPRRKMGPIIFHKSSSQDRLIEELQGKLGISRKEKLRKHPDDWLTEGVIVMNNPKRNREDGPGVEIDKIIIPPDSPLPPRKVLPMHHSPPAPRPPVQEPNKPPPVKEAPPPLPPPPPPAPSPPPPQEPPPVPPPEHPIRRLEAPSPPIQRRPPSPPAPVVEPAVPKPSVVRPPPLQSAPPLASTALPKKLVSVGCQTEYDPLFPPMQTWNAIMAQGKGPQPQANKLDNMLGSLQSDLNRLGVQTVAKGVCGACSKPIVGQVVTAMGRTWHPEHFVCTHCQEEIGSRNFFERDGLPYCERDYHHLFSPRCYYCNGPILDRVVTALDRTWHPEHFFCAQCGSFFGEEGFHEKDGKAYCRKDYFDMFAPKCGGCARAILDNYISALSCLWHPECFVCRECFTPFVHGSFFEHDGQPFCEMHYHERRGSLCSGCQKPITGRCITAMGKKFHPEHFVCAFCLKQLNKGTFKEQNDKPYCHGCFLKLFS